MGSSVALEYFNNNDDDDVDDDDDNDDNVDDNDDDFEEGVQNQRLRQHKSEQKENRLNRGFFHFFTSDYFIRAAFSKKKPNTTIDTHVCP